MLGGGARYARALARQLLRHEHRVTVLTTDARQERDFWERRPVTRGVLESRDELIRVIHCPVAGFPVGRAALMAWRKAMIVLSALPGDRSDLLMCMARRIPSVPTLASTLSRLDGYDLVHGFNLSWEYPLIEGWRFARDRGLPFVVTPFTHLGVDSEDRTVRNNTMDHQCRILKDADAVLTLTWVEREGLIRYSVSPERVFIVGGGLDPIPSAVEQEQAAAGVLQRYGLSVPIILFIGRVNRDKGAIDACEAARRLFHRGTRLNLALVGQPDAEFQRYYKRLQADEKRSVRPLGMVPEGEKHALLSLSTMLVLPSRVDSFGLVLLEAWAHGKPVIGARAGGIPGVIREGQDGLLVPYGDVSELADAMALLLRDEALARTMGSRGQQRLAGEYSWESVYQRVAVAYDYARANAGAAIASGSRR